MKASIITVGDELLSGERLDTNSQWLGQYLSNHNVEVRRILNTADHLGEIEQALRAALNEEDLVILTGGLGPTNDDRTKEALQNLFQIPLTRHEPTLAHIKKYFDQKNRKMTESNYRQADVLSNCEVLFNETGTAPGMWFEVEGVGLAGLPGVPHEMKYLMKERVQPKIERLKSWMDCRPVAIYYLQTAGVGESTLSDEVLPDLPGYESDQIKIAFLPHPGGVSIRVNAYGESLQKARNKAEPVLSYIREQASGHIFHEGREHSLEGVLGELLSDSGKRIAVAESCTGGLLLNTLTDVPGSSAYVEGGIIAYSNEMKKRHLDVTDGMLVEHGAVSKEVALQMCRAAAARSDADIGVSTTGIAGPTGGSADKPVGMVWIGYWSVNEHFAVKANFTKDRLINKQKSVAVAMDLVRRRIQGIESTPYALQLQYH